MFRMEEGITRKNKMSFFSRLNPFSKKKNSVSENSEEKVVTAKKRKKLSFNFKRNRKLKYTSKYRNYGRPWWEKMGLNARPDNNSLTPLKPFGTFSKIGRFV
ncbi:MAG TPA: hypothetical protein PLT92_13685 [Ignavibacteriaceae bacterium]|nr:hypothetical protein [Ignavibacteriaceae bacterium]